MDQVKTGRFIAALRHEQGLTQEALGEKLGVSNKTVSRWENGNYMPDIDMLQILSRTFDVSINELLSGERLSDEAFRSKADENIIAVTRESSFSREEKEAFFKEKWRKDHKGLLILFGLIVALALVLPVILGKPWFSCLAPILALVFYGHQNNRMMAYVERQIYD